MSGDAGESIATLVGSRLRDVPDFPIPGVLFKDITPLLADSQAFAAVITALAGSADGQVDLVAGIEARGFLLAGALATELGCGMVPIRKAGKLPPPTLTRSYALEYGTAELEVPVNIIDGKRVLLVDDVLATGGTVKAAAELIAEAGGTVTGIAVLLEIEFLAGRSVVADIAPLTALLRI
jgi:adenine phosphoribosyltransferase